MGAVTKGSGSASASATPTQILTAEETITYDPELFLTAVVIYQFMDRVSVPVARIELLSPTNKAPGDGYLQYIEKRRAAVQQGTPLVEIDYLHESPTPIHLVPSYPDGERDALSISSL